MSRIEGLIITIAVAALLAGCAASGNVSGRAAGERIRVRVVRGKAKVRRNAPYKEAPPGRRVEATQRPYTVAGRTYYPLPTAHGFVQTGIASWYGRGFHGKKTSSGETYDMHAMTAAHKTLPMNTMLLVENLENGRKAVVRVNDRGPFVRGRIIDLSYAAAKRLGYAGKGTARVRITALAEAERRRGGAGTPRLKRHPDFDAGEFFVQIGAFRDRQNAVRLKDRMLSWGRKALVVKGALRGRPIYRVQVRAGRSLKKARHVERALEHAGFSGAFVIAR
jgi:rare lipoprotein A